MKNKIDSTLFLVEMLCAGGYGLGTKKYYIDEEIIEMKVSPHGRGTNGKSFSAVWKLNGERISKKHLISFLQYNPKYFKKMKELINAKNKNNNR